MGGNLLFVFVSSRLLWHLYVLMEHPKLLLNLYCVVISSLPILESPCSVSYFCFSWSHTLLFLLPLSFSLQHPPRFCPFCVIILWVKVSGRRKCLLSIFIYLRMWPWASGCNACLEPLLFFIGILWTHSDPCSSGSPWDTLAWELTSGTKNYFKSAL